LALTTFITGQACRLPGADDVASLTRALFEDRDLVTEIPESRWAHGQHLHPAPAPVGKSYVMAAGVLSDLWGFDAEAFGLSPREAALMDPQQRLLLQVVHEALEDAGIRREQFAGEPVGVYVGASTMTHGSRLAQDPLLADPYMMTGNTLSLVSNRVSHAFDLRGPSLTVDTACSSSLFAFDLAVKAMARGEIDTAIVAGTNILLDPVHFAGFSAAHMLSPTGRSRPFSAAADGYVRSEGVVAFVLERKAPASLAPRRARAAVLGVGTNSDGRTLTAALPSLAGQTALLREVYAAAEVDPATLAFVEAHGTGTAVGDPVEAMALGRALGQRRDRVLPIGSIKSNIGHLEPASGAAGVLKALIAFENGCYPGTLHAETLNPAIDFEDLNLSVVRSPLDLADGSGQPNRAGISSFGFGGANAHMIIERVTDAPAQKPAVPERAPVLMVSAATEKSLRGVLARWSARIAGDAPDAAALADLAGQAQAFRSRQAQRVAVLCGDAATTAETLDRAARGVGDPRAILGQTKLSDAATVFVFSGNGAQYAGMGQVALATDAVYAAKMHEIDALFGAIAGWSILEQLENPALDDALRDCDIAQPLLFADQVAQVAALAARGLHPAAVIGHSAGEVAAAHVAGALSLSEALSLIYWRSVSQRPLRGQGGMAALQVGADEAAESLAEFGRDLHLAADNSPRSVTLVGSNEAIAEYTRFARRSRRWACVKLDIDYPYHAPAQEAILGPMRDALAGMTATACALPMVSTVTGALVEGQTLGADYWCDNVRHPVRFRDAVETLKEMGFKAFLEIGPSPVLVSYVRDSIGPDVPDAAVFAGFEKKDSIDPVGRTLARAAVHGCALDAGALAPDPVAFDRTLPRTPWSNETYRVDTTPSIERQNGTGDDYHRLLGIEDGAEGAVWRTDLDLAVLPEIGDHRVGGQALYPATAFVETALAAAQRALSAERVELRDLDITAPLRLSDSGMITLRTSARASTATVQIESAPRMHAQQWRGHLRARFYACATVPDFGAAPDPELRSDDTGGEAVYGAARAIGLDYGPRFQRLSHLRRVGDDRVEVILDPFEPIAPGHKGTRVHALDLVGADAVFHGVIGALAGRGEVRHGYVPVRIGRLVLMQPAATLGSGRITIVRVGRRSVLADFELFATDGAPVALLQGVRFQAAQLVRGIDPAQHAYRFVTQVLETADGHRAADNVAPGLEEAMALAHDAVFAPQDEGAFMIEGIAQQIVLDAVRDLASDQELIVPPGGEGGAYFDSAMSILVRAGLARPEGAGWRLVPSDKAAEAPEVLRLVAGLVARRPDLGSEAALLARLASGLAETLRNPPEDARAHFGREALANLAEGGVFALRRQRLLVRLALALAESWPATAPLRIAEISDGQARLLPALVEGCAQGQVTLAEVVVPCRGEAGAAVALPLERVERFPELAAATSRFDLILVPGLFERAADPATLAAQLATLLAPGGTLLATADAPGDFTDLVHGFDTDWFIGHDAEGQPLSRLPLSDDLSGWASTAGLASAAAMLPDGFGMASLMVARHPDQEQADDPAPGDANLELEEVIEALVSGRAHPQVAEVPGALMRIARPGAAGIAALVHARSDATADAAPDAIVAARLLALRDLCGELGADSGGAPSALVAIVPGGTGLAPARPVDPLQSALWGALRVVTNEYPGLTRVAFDAAAGITDAELAHAVASHLAQASGENEVIVSDGARHGLRVERGLPEPARGEGDDEAQGTVLVAPVTGGLDDLAWTIAERTAPGPGEIEVALAATGLNYRDVMWAMGLLPEEALEKGFAGPTLGMEFSGRVVRCGAGVTAFAPGDPVVGFGPASFASHRTLSTDFVAQLPEGVDIEAAAAIPVAFFTASYALVHLARLSEGETVLIHGGAGGVGLAAIQIARSLGARVIATAGTPVKRALLKALGVDVVLDSRSTGFADDVRRLTDGRGVDVVLNALAGEAMEASLNALAPFGRFLELGKQDYYANTMIGLRPLKENIAYFGIDVDQLIAAQPALAGRLFAEMLTGFEAGQLRPIACRVFDGTQVIDAFRLMQKSGHVGKIVVRPRAAASLPGMTSGAGFRAAHDGAHLVIGGLGGLGLEVADWLIRRGARHVVLTGRRGLQPDAPPDSDPQSASARIARWRAMGITVSAEACDVADPEAVGALLDRLRAEGPIRGVIHSAMVLDDRLLSQVDADSLARTLPAKVAGAAVLDRLTRNDRLDYFVLFSSVAAMFGNHGQSAYVAANGYLEGLARQRSAAGLPGLAVGWGAVSDAGYLAREGQQAERIRRATGDVAFTVGNLTEALDHLLAPGAGPDPVQYVSTMRWGALTRSLRTLAEPGARLLRAMSEREGNEGGDDSLRAELLALPPRKAEARLVGFLVERIANILRVSGNAVKTGQPIGSLGMDSLMGVEFGLTLEQALGDAVPVSLISESYSIDQIARNLIDHLRSAGEGDDGLAATLAAKHGAGPTGTKASGDES
jgi:phthiocerol/phenolphthiocerol synthesis type-I polyketide synthase C